MTKWLLSIVGIVFLGVLFDLLYPNGKTNKLCKSIFAIIATFIMIFPLLNLSADNVFDNLSENTVLIKNINQAKEESCRLQIISHLNNAGIVGVSVEIESNLDYKNYEIENIYVDVTNLVLTEKITNINKYEVVAKEISSVVNIPEERIVVYG